MKMYNCISNLFINPLGDNGWDVFNYRTCTFLSKYSL